jgi:hypothetical protein
VGDDSHQFHYAAGKKVDFRQTIFLGKTYIGILSKSITFFLFLFKGNAVILVLI